MDADIAVLARLWRSWHATGAGLSTVDWRRPTRCGDWTVAALYAHVSQGVGGLDVLLARHTPGRAPTADAVTLLRRFHAHAAAPTAPVATTATAATAAGAAPVTGATAAVPGAEVASAAGMAVRNARTAERDAGRSAPEELVARFAGAAGALGRADPCLDLVVDYFGHGLVRLGEAVRLRIMESTVHLLDLDDALGRPPSAPPDAVEQALRLLLAVPDPVLLIEVATGRRTDPVLPLLA